MAYMDEKAHDIGRDERPAANKRSIRQIANKESRYLGAHRDFLRCTEVRQTEIHRMWEFLSDRYDLALLGPGY
jgi:hypothetical protein